MRADLIQYPAREGWIRLTAVLPREGMSVDECLKEFHLDNPERCSVVNARVEGNRFKTIYKK